MMQSALMGKRVTSKQLPLGLCEMPADFINAYVLGSLGATGATIGACATFLYNLRQGVEDIRADGAASSWSATPKRRSRRRSSKAIGRWVRSPKTKR